MTPASRPHVCGEPLCTYPVEDIMTIITHTPTTTSTDPADSTRFRESEDLRRVLLRICGTEDGWRTDPDAEPLLRYAADRFTHLAAKHGLEAEDALSAVFEVMRTPSVRYGRDPWAVVVTGVATMFRAWQFADEALTSLETARRGGLSGCCAERFSDRDVPIWELDPHLAVDLRDEPVPVAGPSIPDQARQITSLFTPHGWPPASTVVAVEVILRKLADAGSRPSAYEALRRDRRWRAVTGLPADAWTCLLRLILGTPGQDVTNLGKGILMRIALGETGAHLRSDQELAQTIKVSAPGRNGESR